MNKRLDFVRLIDVSADEIVRHMSHPRLAAHMPLLSGAWDKEWALAFVAAKEEFWARDGLGHWGFLCDGEYVGWGGFQKEGEDWDFGLVLLPERFGLGLPIAKKALAFARANSRIPYVTFLLPKSRRHLGALARLGAKPVGDVTLDGISFRKYRLDTATEG